jgi:hypothetical protein
MAMEGAATRVKLDQEGSACVLRFVLLADDGAATAVEMRGTEIRGVLDDGDRVLIDPPAAGGDGDGVLRPRRLRNQTTTSLVSVWEPPLYSRIGGKVATLLISTAISTLVTFALGLILGGGEPEGQLEQAPPPVGGGGEDGTDWFPFVSPLALVEILVLSAIIWGIWFAAFGRRRRRRVIWPGALGIVLGVTVGLWVAALLGDFEVG